MEGVLVFSLALILSVAAATPARGEYYSDSVTPLHMREKVTHLHFFLHDILSGKNPSVVKVAQANLTRKSTSPTPFSAVMAADDTLRVGPEPNSKIIGNAQGLYMSSSQDESKLTLVMYMDFGFTTGKFNGSSISVFSRNPITEKDREVAVVGGRGKFRLARGFAKIKTSFLNITNGDAILEYNVTVFHYEF